LDLLNLHLPFELVLIQRAAIGREYIRYFDKLHNKHGKANLYLIDDPNDVPILHAAMKAKIDYLATHHCKHFLDDPKVAEKSGLKIGTPGDVLAWIRENL